MSDAQAKIIYEEGKALLKAGEIAAGAQALERAIQAGPRTIPGIKAMRRLDEINQKANDFIDPVTLFTTYSETAKSDLTLLIRGGVIFQKAKRLDVAQEWYERALSAPNCPPMAAFNLSIIFVQKGDTEAALRYSIIAAERSQKSVNALHVLECAIRANVDDDSYSVHALRALDRFYGETDAPGGKFGVLVCALPKSASTTLCYGLAQSLNASVPPDKALARPDGILPNTKLIKDPFELAFSKKSVIHVHAAPSDHTFEVINGVDVRKIVVTVRDPRQALVSWTHHAKSGSSYARFKTEFSEFATLSDDEYRAWIMEKSFTEYVEWIEGWIARRDAEPDRIRIVNFEQFIADQKGTIKDLLAWLGEEGKPPEKVTRHRFRSGRTDEWLEFYTPDQVAYLNERMPDRFISEFGWTKK